MGRTITTSSVAALTPREMALQDGTPKWIRSGENRACYAMLSKNTSSSVGGVTFYDKYFQQTRSSTVAYSTGSAGNDGIHHYLSAGSDGSGYEVIFESVTGTQTTPSTTATVGYLNATNSAGEFGNAMGDVYSNGTVSRISNRGSGYASKHYLNAYAINSDHSDRALVYLLSSGRIRAVSRIDGYYSFSAVGTSDFQISGLNTAMQGSASYNAVRKELVILSYISAGSFTVIKFSGVDFNRFKSPHVALANATREDKTLTIVQGWAVSNAESYYNAKPVLCDNGDIYVSVMFTSSMFSLFKATPTATATLSGGVVQTKTLTTSYGLDQGGYYGQRSLDARDGGAVMIFCPYYYYGCGMQSNVVDKRKSALVVSSQLDYATSGQGVLALPYGDSGFTSYYAGNVYTGNPGGSFLMGFLERNGEGDIVNLSTNVLLPIFTGPNTTNYPGFTQVVDYPMLNNQSII